MLLLVSHAGIAAAFTYWNPKLSCPSDTSDPDRYGTCKLLNIYVLIGCWIDPVLLLAYSSGLMLGMFRRSSTTGESDEEKQIGHLSMMQPNSAGSPKTVTFPGIAPPKSVKPDPNVCSTSQSKKLPNTESDGHRLSKPLPMCYF